MGCHLPVLLALCLVAPLLHGTCAAQTPFAWDVIADTQASLADALRADQEALQVKDSFSLFEMLATNRVLARTPEVVALVSLDEYGRKLISDWDAPYSINGVAQILPCPRFVLPRFNEPPVQTCWRSGQEAAAEQLIERLYTDEQFRMQYRKFLCWSGVFFAREERGPFKDTPSSTIAVNYDGLARDLQANAESAGKASWWLSLRCAALALSLGDREFFETPVRPENVRAKFAELSEFYTQHSFCPHPDGFGWMACKDAESPDALRFVDRDASFVENILFASPTFDQAVRIHIVLNSGDIGTASMLLGDDGERVVNPRPKK